MRPHVVGGGFYLKAAKWKGYRPFCIQRSTLCKVAKAGAWSEGGHGVQSHDSTGQGGRKETGRKEAVTTVQPRGKVAWLGGGRREGNVDMSRASGDMRMDLEMTGQGIPGIWLVCMKDQSLR